METRQLRAFSILAEELHFGRAARRLGVSQPALSLAIRSLEHRLGVKIFARDRRKVELTGAGKSLLRDTAGILRGVEDAIRNVRQAGAGFAGSLSIGFVTPVEYAFLPRLLRNFHRRYPQINLNLHEMMSDDQAEMLRAGMLDVGFVSAPLSLKGFERREVLSEPLILAIPADDALARVKRAPNISDLKDRNLVVFPRVIAPALHDALIAAFTHSRIVPLIAQEARQSQTIVSLASAGLGIGVVPGPLRHLKRDGVIYREFGPRAPLVRIDAMWRTGVVSEALVNFLAELQVLLAQAGRDP